MHDHRVVREQLDVLREAMSRRGKLESLAPALARAEQLDRDRRAGIQAVEERKARRNALSQEVARRKRAGEPADALIDEGRAVGEEIARLERDADESQRALDALLLEIPNQTLADVPAGGEGPTSSSAAGASNVLPTECARTGRWRRRRACSIWSAGPR